MSAVDQLRWIPQRLLLRLLVSHVLVKVAASLALDLDANGALSVPVYDAGGAIDLNASRADERVVRRVRNSSKQENASLASSGLVAIDAKGHIDVGHTEDGGNHEHSSMVLDHAGGSVNGASATLLLKGVMREDARSRQKGHSISARVENGTESGKGDGQAAAASASREIFVSSEGSRNSSVPEGNASLSSRSSPYVAYIPGYLFKLTENSSSSIVATPVGDDTSGRGGLVQYVASKIWPTNATRQVAGALVAPAMSNDSDPMTAAAAAAAASDPSSTQETTGTFIWPFPASGVMPFWPIMPPSGPGSLGNGTAGNDSAGNFPAEINDSKMPATSSDPIVADATNISTEVEGLLFPSNSVRNFTRWAMAHRRPTEPPPSGIDIWRENLSWVHIQKWHPAGVVSNLNGGVVKWLDVSYMSYKVLLLMTIVSYPAIAIVILMVLTVLVSVSLTQDEAYVHPQEAGDDCDHHDAPEVANKQKNPALLERRFRTRRDIILPLAGLSSSSRVIYEYWTYFCRAIPSCLVFGLPTVLLALSVPYPQEVYVALALLTTGLVFSNGVYMVVFAGHGIMKMNKAMNERREALTPYAGVVHWVIIPQYQEEIEVVSLALRSIARSTLGKSSIGIILGMEARERAAVVKAKTLQETFRDDFQEMLVTYHPAGLPNDPPGKASNVSWAFKELTKHLQSQGRSTSNVLLTCCDADSKFHDRYFEALTQAYLNSSEKQRRVGLWQSPMFHIKNYHRLPYPIVPLSVMTCISELAVLNDPHAARFPYSTYSLSMTLALHVGGWDSEWIAEDWHMGIKCFLYTHGQANVQPIFLPTVNYVPEESGWCATISARWSQAKRHALGFSDLTYYFMTLPLVHCSAVSRSATASDLQNFWSTIFFGLTLVIKFVNVHVCLGVITTYSIGSLGLECLMSLMMSEDRNVGLLMEQVTRVIACLWILATVCTCIVASLFCCVYKLVKNRVEGPAFQWNVSHWCYTAGALLLMGPTCFLFLGVAVWKASWNCLVETTFDYEVAAKPPPSLLARNRLEQYCFTVRDTLSQLGEASIRDQVANAVNEAIAWREENPSAEKHEIQACQKRLEEVVNPVMIRYELWPMPCTSE